MHPGPIISAFFTHALDDVSTQTALQPSKAVAKATLPYGSSTQCSAPLGHRMLLQSALPGTLSSSLRSASHPPDPRRRPVRAQAPAPPPVQAAAALSPGLLRCRLHLPLGPWPPRRPPAGPKASSRRRAARQGCGCGRGSGQGRAAAGTRSRVGAGPQPSAAARIGWAGGAGSL